MAFMTTIDEAKAASKRKRELDDHGKSKRTKRDKGKGSQKEPNGTGESFAKHEKHMPGSASESPLFDPSVHEMKQERQTPLSKREKKTLAKVPQDAESESSAWKISQPMGGRMLNIDPILTRDEQYLILAYNTSVQVYSAVESLLIRKVSLPVSAKVDNPENIIAMSLSPTYPNSIWVASSTGRIWLIDWTNGAGADSPLQLHCVLLSGFTVQSVKLRTQPRDTLFISVLFEYQWHIWACDIEDMSLKHKKTLLSREDIIENLQSVQDGRYVAASSRKDILLGSLWPNPSRSAKDFAYEFFILDCSDEITCLDIRTTERVHLNNGSQLDSGDDAVLDIVVGGARGAIYSYNDPLPRLHSLHEAGGRNHSLQPRKYHWHRKAVHAVKWSQDGNYIISGGSETVLVQWQIDTGKIDVLPHLTATIENIVISSRGSSYIIHLDDNSTMIMSTAEMKPTTYISGIQTVVAPPPPSKDNFVKRTGQVQDKGIISRIPAAVDPVDPTRLLLCVGNGQQSSLSGSVPSAPMLQTLDLSTIQGIAKQAVTRTHPTDVNTTSKGYALTEPRVTNMAYSHDGKWLATVDEWQPPSRDTELLESPSSDRREVYLKFWTPGLEAQTLELVSRINAPHYTGRDERVLDLAADPTTHRFATIGEDGVVRMWQPAMRQRDGIAIKSRTGRKLESWACARTIYLQEDKALADSHLVSSSSTLRRSGAISFSEDGSMLACAFQNGSESAVYVVDVESGKVVDSLDGLINGEVQSIQVLSSQLIVLSQILVVYNIVLDELSYGLHLSQAGSTPAIPLLSQLIVDYPSQSFAVAISRANKQGAVISELAVFRSDHCRPDVVHHFPHPVVSIMTSPGSSGYLVLDSAAQLWSVSQSTDMQSVILAQPLADINLDQEANKAEEASIVAVVVNEDDGVVSDDEMDLDAPEDEADDDGVYPVVIAPQKLAELFDSAPPFAMPPIEDMFYQVTKLFSTKPAAVEAT
ncbi:quinon protein alcohol dehydrogenase-like superfamily [Xylariales sp. AK1849]|nr:quinon protein alcohol dehydrogenase-like superfamily [Xylariales sp. AK1849]